MDSSTRAFGIRAEPSDDRTMSDPIVTATLTDAELTSLAQIAAPAEQPARLAEFWRHFSANAGAVAGLTIVVAVLLVAVFAGVLAPHSPTAIDNAAYLKPPAWLAGGSWTYPLGTDAIGRDILSRLMYGARLSLSIGVAVVTLSVIVGTFLGMAAAFFRGVTEIAIMRLMDVLLSLPSLLLAIVIVAILGPGLMNAMLAVAVVVLPHYVRTARAAALTELSRDYVTAARMVGASNFRLMFREVLPNCMAPLIVQASLGVSTAILDAAALGFLGLGAQPPSPEWGTMLADAREFVLRAWWVVTFPGLVILITVLAFNLLGDGLRDALDPKLKR
jgi:dipeptide transport system permease protein